MIFCNGVFTLEDEPVIEVSDRGFLFGDAVFTTIKVVDGQPKFLDEHFQRLQLILVPNQNTKRQWKGELLFLNV